MKQIVTNYSFDKTAKTITFTDFTTILLNRIMLITNVTSNVIIYQFNSSTLNGTVATNVLTLTYNTSAMANTDKLQIIYDLAVGDTNYSLVQPVNAASLPLPTGAATSSAQTTAQTSLTSIDGKIPVLGQALAAASVPVILPSATITTLTPPSNTGYALDSSLTTIDTDLKSNITLHAGTNIVGKVTTDQTTHGTTDLVAADITKIAGGTAINSGVTGALATGGDTAAAASDAGNPVKTGGVGKTANPTAVTDGQRTNFITDKLGKQVVVGSIRDLKANTVTTITSSTAETTIVAAIASTFNDLYGLILSNSGVASTTVTVKDSTAGTTQAHVTVPAGETRGFVLNESAALKQTTVNTNWTATCGTSVASLIVTALYVKNI